MSCKYCDGANTTHPLAECGTTKIWLGPDGELSVFTGEEGNRRSILDTTIDFCPKCGKKFKVQSNDKEVLIYKYLFGGGKIYCGKIHRTNSGIKVLRKKDFGLDGTIKYFVDAWNTMTGESLPYDITIEMEVDYEENNMCDEIKETE